MRRREFLCAAAGAAVLTAAQTFRAGIVPANEARQADAETAFWLNCDAVSALGFHLIEFNNTRTQIVEVWAARAAEFREKMAARHLTLAGAALFSHIADASARHMTIGRFLSAVGGGYITHMIAPGAVLNEPADESEYAKVDVKTWARNANEIGMRLANEHGVALAYHPEQGEFRSGLAERILDATDERWFRLVVDTGHAASGGKDALEILKRHRGRLVCVHLKDFAPGRQPMKAGNVPFGDGSVDLAGIAAFLHDTSFTGWVMAESGGTNEQMHSYMTARLALAI